MSVAIITGASSGLGIEFARRVEEYFPNVDTVWLIARNEKKLQETAGYLKKANARVIPMDLCKAENFDVLEAMVKEEKPEIELLINNAGSGYLGNIGETSWKDQAIMTELNVRALAAVTEICVPFIKNGGRIITISSIASFCPNPRLTVYSATKAFASFFSRGLGDELRPRGIKSTAVCPGPMATNFIEAAKITGRSKTFQVLPYCNPEKVTEGALKASKAGRAVYTPTAFYKFYRGLAKVMPQWLMIKFTRT